MGLQLSRRRPWQKSCEFADLAPRVESALNRLGSVSSRHQGELVKRPEASSYATRTWANLANICFRSHIRPVCSTKLSTRTAAFSLTRRLVVYSPYVAYSAVHHHRWARQRISFSHPRLSPHCIALTDLFRDYDLKESAHNVTRPYVDLPRLRQRVLVHG